MSRFLKQSTSITLRVGPFVDDSDGKTAETGLTISQADVRLSKAGAAFAQKNDATSATHDENGWYSIPLNTTDTGTLGMLSIAIAETGALPVWEHFMVIPANVFDSIISGSDYLQADTVQIEGSDATNQIRDAVVDDATRIDASAINTLSGHDPGENIMGATDLNTQMGRIDATVSSRATEAKQDIIDTNVDAVLLDTGTTLPANQTVINDNVTAVGNAVVALNDFDPANDTVAHVTLVDTNSDMRGTENAALASVCTESRLAELDAANLPTGVAAIPTTPMRGTDGANTVIPDAAGTAATPAQVNAEVVDALSVDTYAEIGQGTPPSTASLITMIRYLFKAWRNKKTQTATELAIYNDAGDTVDQKATVSDDGTTATKGAIVGGP